MAKSSAGAFFVEEGNLGIYLREISRFQPLSAADEFVLAERIRNGDRQAQDKLVKANLRFVVSVARNYQNQGMTLVDLINEGNLGLIKASGRFDEKKNFKFISYAVWWIRQAILQGLADNSRIVKVPLNRVATIHKVGRTRIALEQKLFRAPSNAEIARELSLGEEEVRDTFKIGGSHTSLDAPLGDIDGGSLLDILHDASAQSPDETIEEFARATVVENLFSTLTEREREIIRLYFGVGEELSYTLSEIGERLSITRERVRQIKDGALRKLKSSKDINLLRDEAAY